MKQMVEKFLRWLAQSLGLHLGVSFGETYTVECVGPDGVVKWTDTFHNLVTNEGRTKIVDACFKTGLASPAWYVGLVKTLTGSYDNSDTLASHGTGGGWTEAVPGTDYTGNRQAWTPGSITGTTTVSVDNSASKASFPILTTMTLKGALFCSVATGTSGTLMGVGNFTGGDKAVANGDTVNVTVTPSLT